MLYGAQTVPTCYMVIFQIYSKIIIENSCIIIFVINNMLFLVNTTRDIDAGEEILISYGKRTFQGTYLTVYGFTVDPKLNDVGKVD